MSDYEQRIKRLETQVEALFNINDDLKNKLKKEAKRRVELVEENRQLRIDLKKANQTIANLTTRLKKNSSNSGKPSSTDSIYTKTIHNFREKTNRKIGGQKGHKGHTIEMLKSPTKIIDKKVDICDCGGKIENHSKYTAKQLVDIKIEVEVIEERVYEGKCTKCGKYHIGKFSKNFKNPVQYGTNIKALTTLLVDEGYISLNRCADLIKSLTKGKIALSQGTIINFKKELAENSLPMIERIKENLIKSDILHVDETGIRVTGKLEWLHTTTNNKFTLYQVQSARKLDEKESMKILSYYVGILMHDHFKSYYGYTTMTHAECNVHILRYLKAVIESFDRNGAKNLLNFLVSKNEEKKIAMKYGFDKFSDKKLEEIEQEYEEILENWHNEFLENTKGKTLTDGLIEERNLFKRLLEYKEEHLLFLKNFKVPFDNNVAERSLRMIKTKLKVSGSFRGKDKGNYFAIVRSIIETAKKHKMNILDVLTKLFNKDIFEFSGV